MITRYIRIVLAWLFGGLASLGMLAFALPMSISADRSYLLPITFLFTPVMLVGALVAMIFGPLGQAISVGLYYEDSLHGFPGDEGLVLKRHNGEVDRTIPWTAIRQIVSVFRPPISDFRIYLTDGSNIDIGTLATDGLASRLESLGIDWLPPSDKIHYAELDEFEGNSVE